MYEGMMMQRGLHKFALTFGIDMRNVTGWIDVRACVKILEYEAVIISFVADELLWSQKRRSIPKSEHLGQIPDYL
jgi:hypothetical protein